MSSRPGPMPPRPTWPRSTAASTARSPSCTTPASGRSSTTGGKSDAVVSGLWQTPVMSLVEFISGLPKAELHVHHVGSASPRAVAELAARHEGSTPVPADPDQLAEYFTFTDF